MFSTFLWRTCSPLRPGVPYVKGLIKTNTPAKQINSTAIINFASFGNTLRVRKNGPVIGQSMLSVAMKFTTAPAAKALAS